MDDEVHVEAVPVDRHRDRVDKERHVVVDDVDDGVRRVPTLGCDRRRVHPHERIAGRAATAELPLRDGRARDVVGVGERVVECALRDEDRDERVGRGVELVRPLRDRGA